MKPQKPNPPNQNDWERLPFDMQLYITARIFLAVEFPRIAESILKFLYRVDLWFFPPLAFLSTCLVTSKYFPPHPIKIFAILSTAFMFSTLNLFLLRPRKWKRTAYWVKINN